MIALVQRTDLWDEVAKAVALAALLVFIVALACWRPMLAAVLNVWDELRGRV